MPNYPGLRAGQLRDLVEFQERIDREDSAGAPLPADWKTIGREWADIAPTVGLRRSEIESMHDRQLIAASTYKVTIRFRADLTERHRVVFVGPPRINVNIIGVPQDPDGRRRRLVLICEAGLVDG